MSRGRVPTAMRCTLAFTRSAHRTHKKSDGTIIIEGRRFEVPNRYRHLNRIEVRYAGWNLGLVYLVDERTGHVLARLYPQDKTQNASGPRRGRLGFGRPRADARNADVSHPAIARTPARPAGHDRSAAAYPPKHEEGDDT